MENVYLKNEVKKHIDQSFNPNFHLHNFELPFRMLVIGSSGGGKSNFVCNLLKRFCAGKGTFDEIKIFCKSKHEPLYEYLAEASKGMIEVIDDLSKLPQINELDTKKQKLFIMDDLVLETNPLISEYWIRARKKNCSLIYLTQSFYKTNKLIRQNCRYFVIVKIAGSRDLSCLLKDIACDKTKEELIKLYTYSTSEKFSVLTIDGDSSERKYRKNFTEYLD